MAYHGSWNRRESTVCKIVTIDMNYLEVKDLAIGCGKKSDDTLFVTGWLKEGNGLGRTMDIIINDDMSLFVSGDGTGEYIGRIMKTVPGSFTYFSMTHLTTFAKYHCHNNNCLHNNLE